MSSGEKPADDPVGETPGKWVETGKARKARNLQNPVVIVDGTAIHYRHTTGRRAIHSTRRISRSKRREQVLIFTYRNLTHARDRETEQWRKILSHISIRSGGKMVLYVRVTDDDNNPVHGEFMRRVKETPAKP